MTQIYDFVQWANELKVYIPPVGGHTTGVRPNAYKPELHLVKYC